MYSKDSLILKKYHSSKTVHFGSNELRKVYNLFNKIKLIELEKIEDFKTNSIENVTVNNPYITENVQKQLKFLKKQTISKFKIGNINLTICIHHKIKENIDKFINELLDLLRFLFSLYPVNRNIEIKYYLTDAKKQLPNFLPDDFTFQRDQANSGSCTLNGSESIVEIWRKEEILKVTIHELIHALCIDEINDTSDIIQHYQNKYQINSEKVNTHEAYTEIWANIINCFWISQKYSNNKKITQYDYFKTLLSIEHEHCLFQTCKLFKIIKLNEKIVNINRDTNILAYYVIRCELYENFKQFLKICVQFSKKNYLGIDQNQWFILLKNNPVIERNDKKISRLKTNDFRYKTTRMTAIEYNLF